MIIAVFDECSRRVDIDGKLMQWDRGQTLQICGMKIEEKQIQVYFTNRCTENALIVIGTVEDGDIFVKIPNELLRKSGIINAYVYQTMQEEGKTTFEVRLGVKARKKPQDYEAPEDKYALEQILEQLNKKGDRLYLEENSGSGQNIYDEYLWVNGKYEKLGTREIDLTAYAKKTELPTKTSQLTNDSGFLTGVPAEYVTETELNGKGYQTGAQVTQAITNATRDMATNTGVEEKLEGYALKTEIPTVESISNSEIDSLFTA